MSAPAALLLDDGDLGAVEDVLNEMGIDVLRLSGGEARRRTLRPTRLLVTSGNVSFNLPPLESEEGFPEPEPIWICVHKQDFLPLRDRLRALGVKFLVQRVLDRNSLQHFLAQLLYQGPERRFRDRLALGGTVRYRSGRVGGIATLVDVSAEACALHVEDPIPPGTLTRAVLPRSLGGGEELELEGSVSRCEPNEDGGHVVVFTLENSQHRHLQRLRALTEGKQIGTRVTPLVTAAGEPQQGDSPNTPRQTHDAPARSGGTTRDLGEDLVLGHDLSIAGVRITGASDLELGASLRVALYGDPSDAPLKLEARVLRDQGPAGVTLTFENVNPKQRERLDVLCARRPDIVSLEGEVGSAGRVVVSKVVERHAR